MWGLAIVFQILAVVCLISAYLERKEPFYTPTEQVLSKTVESKTVEPGQVYRLIQDDNPFARPVEIVILDVKNGFVQYHYINMAWSMKSSCTIGSIERCYKRVK